MIIGVPRETAPQEGRVGLVPASVAILRREGHEVRVQQGAGAPMGVHDHEYIRAGAEVLRTLEDIYDQAELVWKVEAPSPSEMALCRPGQVIFGFLHLAAHPERARALAEADVVAFACEALQHADGSLPLLRPMSEVAGRLSIQEAARYLQQPHGGRGVLLGGVPGVGAASVAVLGAGVAGTNAARAAAALGAHVTVLDRDLRCLRRFDDRAPSGVRTLYASAAHLEEALIQADIVVGTVGVPGDRAPCLVERAQLGLMKPAAVVIDISIDGGGCFATSRPTTHADPVRTVDGIVHHAVPNMPGAVPRTSTPALNHVSLDVGLRLAALGWERAAEQDPELATALVLCRGEPRSNPVARALHAPASP